MPNENTHYPKDVWKNFNDAEIKRAKSMIHRAIFGSIISLIIIFGALALVIVRLRSEEPVENRTLYIIMIVTALLLSLLKISYMNGYILLYKEVSKKFGLYLILLILGTLAAYGMTLLAGFGLLDGLRKKVVKKTSSGFATQHQSNSKDNDLVLEGYKYLFGKNDYPVNEKKAYDCFEKAASKGHSAAYLQLGFRAEDQGNYQEAKDCYQSAFKLRNGRGAYFIARMIEKGHGYRVDDKHALQWYKKAADLGEPLSQYYIGIALLNGRHIAKDEVKGLDYLEKSAAQDEYDALFYLGVRCGCSAEQGLMDLVKAESYLTRAVSAAEDDEEKSSALNELGRIMMVKYGESDHVDDYALGLQLFKLAQDLGHEHGRENVQQALLMRPHHYPSKDELLTKDLISPYLASVNHEQVASSVNVSAPPASTTSSQAPYVDEDLLEEYRGLAAGLLITSIFKAVCFGAGLAIILWARGKAEELTILLPIVYVFAVVVAGLPGLPKAFNNSYNYNKKWDRFFGRAEYKATIDLDRNKVTVKKNTDWFSIIYITLLNLLQAAMFMPFEVIRDLYRFIVIKKKIKEIS